LIASEWRQPAYERSHILQFDTFRHIPKPWLRFFKFTEAGGALK
jgi:hypothetical protein